RERVFRGEEFEFRKLALVGAGSPPDERLLWLDLGTDPDRPRFRLVAELHTNQWNLLLLRMPGAEIERVLWPRRPGATGRGAASRWGWTGGGRSWDPWSRESGARRPSATWHG
ncbi:MAG: hypothetical protein ABEJ46_05065, partial [Gemmatimonadota bacterium]